MTIFQAKGLEFDVVIIPQMGRKVRGQEKELLVWTENETGLRIAALPPSGEEDETYKSINEVSKKKDDNESRRLFYVACTRAKDELHLIGSTGTKQSGTQCRTPATGTFLKLIWDSAKDEFEGQLRSQATPQQAGFGFSGDSGIPLRRLPTEWRVPELTSAIQCAAPIQRAIASQQEVSYRWVSDTSRHVGTIIHELLRRIAENGPDQWGEARVLSMRNFVGSELLRLGVPGNEEPAAAKKVLRAVVGALHSQRGRWILSVQNDSHSEWAIGGTVGQNLISGTVDRAFRDENGTYWIIDFKNSDHTGTGRAQFLANEKGRYQPQLEQYAAVISRMVSGPVSLGLYFPLLDEWVEWKFAEAAAMTS